MNVVMITKAISRSKQKLFIEKAGNDKIHEKRKQWICDVCDIF